MIEEYLRCKKAEKLSAERRTRTMSNANGRNVIYTHNDKA